MPAPLRASGRLEKEAFLSFLSIGWLFVCVLVVDRGFIIIANIF
jgi:hypothetical protein